MEKNTPRKRSRAVFVMVLLLVGLAQFTSSCRTRIRPSNTGDEDRSEATTTDPTDEIDRELAGEPAVEHIVDNAFEPVITASKENGVAPLPVFFDALETTLPGGTPHDAQYEWVFGDPNSSHPTASGFVAAHVFEHPGTYSVSLTVTDLEGNRGRAVVEVTVREFSGTTFYVSSSGNDSSSGNSESTPFQSFDRGIAALLNAVPRGPSRTAARLLFRRGDTFTTDRGASLGSNRRGDPVIIGAYGEGDRPIINNRGTETTFAGEANLLGWRFMDLDLRGNFALDQAGSTGPTHMTFYTGGDRLVYRVAMRNCHEAYIERGCCASDRSDVFLVDSEVRDVEWVGVHISGARLAVIGNRVERIADSHVLRVWSAIHGVISDNVLYDPSIQSGTGRHALKLHGLPHPPTAYVVVSGNVFRGSVWPVTIAPHSQRPDVRDRVENIIFERNTILSDELSSTPTLIALVVAGRDITVRNNLFLGSPREDDYTAIMFSQYPGIEPIRSLRVQHNTVYQGTPGSDPTALLLRVAGDSVTDVSVVNNIVVGPHAVDRRSGLVYLAEGASVSALTCHHNLVHMPRLSQWIVDNGRALSLEQWQATGQGQGSISADPRIANPQDNQFWPQDGSPARAAGIAVAGGYDDFRGRARARTGAVAMGAYEAAP